MKIRHRLKKKTRVTGGILYFGFIALIWSLLVVFNVNFYVSLLLILFLFILGIGPITSGFNKERLHNLVSRKSLSSDTGSEQLTKSPLPGVNRVSLNFEPQRALLKKCNECGMLLIGSVKRCPNCGNDKFD